MPFSEDYRRQVALLIRTLPAIAEEECFALKGGTAINFFVRDLPRLSVDIDLTFLPAADREEALTRTEWALRRIAERIRTAQSRVSTSIPARRRRRAQSTSSHAGGVE